MAFGEGFTGGQDADPSYLKYSTNLSPEQQAELTAGLAGTGESTGSTDGDTQVASNAPGLPQSQPLPQVAQDVAKKWLAAGYTPEQTAGALGGMNQEAPGFDPRAQNKTSGATGLYQHLGPRLDGLQQHLNATNSDWFDHNAQTDYALNELRGPEAAADRAIRGSKTAEQSALAYGQKFMRPGPGGTPSYYKAAQTQARQFLPEVQRLAAEAQQTSQAPTPEDPQAWGNLAQRRGLSTETPPATPAQPTPAAAQQNAQMPPQMSTSPGGEGDWQAIAASRARRLSTNPMNPATYGAPPHPDTVSDLKAWFGAIGKGLANGWAEGNGFAGDMFNAASDFFAAHPFAQAGGLEAQVAAAQQGAAPGQMEAPGAVGPHIPINSKILKQGIGEGWTQSPREQGDMDPSRNTAFNIASFVGAGSSPGGIAGRATAAGKSVLRRIGSILGHDVGMPASVGAFGETASNLTGALGGTPEEQALAGTAVPLAVGARGLIPKAVFNTAHALAPSLYEKYVAKTLRGSVTPGAMVRGMSDDPNAVVSNLNAGGPDLPAGFEVPAATRSMDEPIQGLFQHLTHNDQIANGRYRAVLSNNTQALDLQPQLQAQGQNMLQGSAGTPQDTINYVTGLRDAQTELTHQRLSGALRDADIAEEAARTDSAGQKLVVGPEGKQNLFNKSAEVVKQIRASRDDTAALADDAWDVARQNGFTTARTQTTPIYDGIEDLMSKHIKSHDVDQSFPWGELGPLYKGDPKGMFDAYGNRVPGTARTGEGNHSQAIMGPTATLEELKTVDSNLARAIRTEQDNITTPGARGNSARLGNLVAARNLVWRQIETGALQNNNYASLRTAMDATKNLHNTYDSGVIGKILNTDIQGQSALDPGAALRTYLGNGERGIANARAIMDTVQNRTGMAEQQAQQMAGNFDPQSVQARTQALQQAQAGAVHPADQMRNDISDWLRQDFLQARADGGQAGAKKWLDNHSEFFNQTNQSQGPFRQLHQELTGLSNADEAAYQMQHVYSPRTLDEIQQSQATHFLNGDPGLHIEAALKGEDPYLGMQKLINMTKQDPTGHAFNGLTSMMLDRTMAAGKVIEDSRGNYHYSGKQAGKFLADNKGAFQALAEADPIAGRNLQRIVNAFDATDRIMSRPSTVGAGDPQKTSMSLSTLGRMFAQIGGAKAAEALLPHAGPMQAPALGSAAMGRVYDELMKKMDVETVTKVLRDAMFDSDKLKTLMQPAATPAAQQAHSQLLEPYFRASMVQAAQPMLNPQGVQPQGHPDNQTIGGPQTPGRLQ